MNEKFCQSCGMPMGATDEMYGLEKDGTKSKDYCNFCYINGEFNTLDGKVNTMEDMIAVCLPHVVSAKPEMNEEAAAAMMREWFPTLKRWKS